MSHPVPRFKFGESQLFVATRTFTLGNTNMQVIEGMEVLFDGTNVEFNGIKQQMPQVRGAIKMGWLTPEASYDENAPAPRPQPAGVQVRHPTQGGNPHEPRQVMATDVEEQERVVEDVNNHAAGVRQGNQTNYRRDPGDVRNRVHGNTDSSQGERFMGAVTSVEAQDGIPVRTLQTPTRQEPVITPDRVGGAINAANKVKIQPGETTKREEDLVANLTDEEKAEYYAEKAARRAAYVAPAEVPAQVVGHVPAPGTQQKEGFTVTGSAGGGTETMDAGGTGVAGKDQEQTVEEGGIKFTQTNGPKKGVRLIDNPTQVAPTEADDGVCRQIARSICSDFPDNYVFTDSPRKKIARLQADYEDRHDVIRAVAAAETDAGIKQRLVKEFPEAFAL